LNEILGKPDEKNKKFQLTKERKEALK